MYAKKSCKLFKSKLFWYLIIIFLWILPLPVNVYSTSELSELNIRTDNPLRNNYFITGVAVYENVNLIWLVRSFFLPDMDASFSWYQRADYDLTFDSSEVIAKYVALSNKRHEFRDIQFDNMHLSNNSNESGPSAGLMLTLLFLDMTKDVDYTGLNIVGTGEVNARGEVLPVGGIKYKTKAVNRSNADIFLVPDLNYLEVLRYLTNPNIRLKPVSTIDEALHYLAKYDKIN